MAKAKAHVVRRKPAAAAVRRKPAAAAAAAAKPDKLGKGKGTGKEGKKLLKKPSGKGTGTGKKDGKGKNKENPTDSDEPWQQLGYTRTGVQLAAWQTKDGATEIWQRIR